MSSPLLYPRRRRLPCKGASAGFGVFSPNRASLGETLLGITCFQTALHHFFNFLKGVAAGVKTI